MKTFSESIQDRRFNETAGVLCSNLASFGVNPMSFVEWYQDEGFARPDTSVNWFINEMGDMRQAQWHHGYDPNARPQQPTQPQMPNAGQGNAQRDPAFDTDVQAAIQALGALRNLPPINGRETFLQKHQLGHAVDSLLQYMNAFGQNSNPAPGNPAPGNPAPGNPAPGNPAPGNPAPGNPAPGNPVNRRNFLNPRTWFGGKTESVFIEHIILKNKVRQISEYVDPELFAEWYVTEGRFYDDPIEFENAFTDFFGNVGGAIKGAFQGIGRGWKAAKFNRQRQQKEQAINNAVQALTKLQGHSEYMKSVPGGEAILPHLNQILQALQQAAGVEQQQDAQAEGGGEESAPGMGDESGTGEEQQHDPNQLAGMLMQSINWGSISNYFQRGKDKMGEHPQWMKDAQEIADNIAAGDQQGRMTIQNKLSEYIANNPKMQASIAQSVQSGQAAALGERLVKRVVAIVKQMQGEKAMSAGRTSAEDDTPADGVTDPSMTQQNLFPTEWVDDVASVIVESIKKQAFIARFN